MTYMDLKKKHQTQVDAFPMAFAFSTLPSHGDTDASDGASQERK